MTTTEVTEPAIEIIIESNEAEDNLVLIKFLYNA